MTHERRSVSERSARRASPINERDHRPAHEGKPSPLVIVLKEGWDRDFFDSALWKVVSLSGGTVSQLEETRRSSRAVIAWKGGTLALNLDIDHGVTLEAAGGRAALMARQLAGSGNASSRRWFLHPDVTEWCSVVRGLGPMSDTRPLAGGLRPNDNSDPCPASSPGGP